MARFLMIVLLLLPLGAPRAAQPPRGEAPALSAPLPGMGFQGFRSLVQSPPALPVAALPVAARAMLPPAPAVTGGGTGAAWPGWLCRAAISAAELRHGVPAGLLQAIGLVESGRTDPGTGTRTPWPWAVNAEGRGVLFEAREAAVAFVRGAEAGGMRSIDIGCLQVNRAHHPHAFASLEQGFDPAANADYAARFLRQLRDGPGGGDWLKAAGFYHSQTPERADAYRARVQAALGSGGALAAMPGGGGQGLSNGAERAVVLPPPPGVAGRGLEAYRLRPVPVASPVASPVVASPAARGAALRRGG